MIEPVDGVSLKPLLTREIGARTKPIPFRYEGKSALVDNRYKLVGDSLDLTKFAIYDLESDPKESRDISKEQPAIAERMRQHYLAWNATVEASIAGKDYPEGKVVPADPVPAFWAATPPYQRYLPEWSKRWEYAGVVSQAAKGAAKKKK